MHMPDIAYTAVVSSNLRLKMTSRGDSRMDLTYLARVESLNNWPTPMMAIHFRQMKVFR